MKLELRRVHHELGTTMIYVTHDQDEALILSDRIAVMREGQIEQIGTPDAVYSRPRNLFVARFVGEGNLLSGRVTHARDGRATIVMEDAEMTGIAAPGVRPGDHATLFIRPEKILLGPADGAAAPLRGVVEDKLYGGELIRYHVRINATKIVVKQPSRYGVFLPDLAQRVSVTWNQDDAIVLPDEPDHKQLGD
jgi:putative spermidine/putrescine transport system ATP-binding protein